jgi:NADH-quinone oxidoreductase subunit A
MEKIFADYSYVWWFLVIGVAFCVVTMWFSWFVRPHNPDREKVSTYECGERPFGVAWVRFRASYFVFMLLFLVFEIEAVFLFPWAAVYKAMVHAGLGTFVFVEGVVFIVILVLGLVYAWAKGALIWD